jgi:hypothetical protein
VVRVRGLRVGTATVQAVVQRGPGSLALRLSAEGGTPTLALELPVPVGARVSAVTVNDSARQVERLDGPSPRIRLDIPLGPRQQIVVLTWEGGLDIVPPTPRLMPGQTSDGIRVLDLAWRDGGWDLLAEGVRGRTYELLLSGVVPRRADGATIVRRADFFTGLTVEFASGTGRETRRIRLTP